MQRPVYGVFNYGNYGKINFAQHVCVGEDSSDWVRHMHTL